MLCAAQQRGCLTPGTPAVQALQFLFTRRDQCVVERVFGTAVGARQPHEMSSWIEELRQCRIRMANFSNGSTPPVREAAGIVSLPSDAHNRRHDSAGRGNHVRSPLRRIRPVPVTRRVERCRRRGQSSTHGRPDWMARERGCSMRDMACTIAARFRRRHHALDKGGPHRSGMTGRNARGRPDKRGRRCLHDVAMGEIACIRLLHVRCNVRLRDPFLSICGLQPGMGISRLQRLVLPCHPDGAPDGRSQGRDQG